MFKLIKFVLNIHSFINLPCVWRWFIAFIGSISIFLQI